MNTNAKAAKRDWAMWRSFLVHLADAGALLLAEAKVSLEDAKESGGDSRVIDEQNGGSRRRATQLVLHVPEAFSNSFNWSRTWQPNR
ncbi:MAG TPA: hypothetical protein VIY49_31935 [Bryobacteraceae bacterium]